MRMSRVPAVIVAAVIGGAVVTACGASGSNPSAVVSTPAAAGGSASALVGTSGVSPTSALTGTPASSSAPAASPTHTHSAAADPSVTATATARPKSSPTRSQASTSSGTHDFTVPAIPGDSVVTAWGSYTKIGTARVKVTMCAKQTGTAFSVGAVALVYSASGASQNIGATILTGPGNTSCVSNTFILYTAHLKVHAFIGGSNGTIVKTGPVLTIY
jgi:hypothetical protein